MLRTVTIVLILLSSVSIILYDFAAWAFGDKATISEVLSEYFTLETNPLIIFIIGFCLGILINHLFGWRPGKDWERI